jgi:cytochrome c
MRTISVTAFIGVWALSGAAVQAGTSDADSAALMTKYNCQSCHSIDKKLVGPAFREIAQKYAGSAGAAASLADKVRNGSTGAWGPSPMPPSSVAGGDLSAMVQWILALK